MLKLSADSSPWTLQLAQMTTPYAKEDLVINQKEFKSYYVDLVGVCIVNCCFQGHN